MSDLTKKRITIGISGAPGVGKTTVAIESAKELSRKYTILFSKDVSRSLVTRGVRINTESETNDYLAFLSVRLQDMLYLNADVVFYERTLLDVLIFMELNGHAHGWLQNLTEQLIRWQMTELSLYFYIPIEFDAKKDNIRITDMTINQRIDQITVNMLKKYRPDFITITGSQMARVKNVMNALSRIGLDLGTKSDKV